MSAFVISSSAAAPALAQNPYWQELNRRLGVNLELNVVSSSDGPIKFSTLIAGNDLPDLIVPALTTPSNIPVGVSNLPEWMKAKCQDLTPFLAGDNIKQYPFLANIPTESWKTTRYNGGIYGVPVPRGLLGSFLMVRSDILREKGVNPQPASFAEFRQVCQELTDAKQNRWALTAAGDALSFISQMLGVPNKWAVRNGRFVADYETPEFKQALSDAAQMVKDGLVHPDSFSSSAPVKQWFGSGASVFHYDRYTGWPQYYQEQTSGPAFELGGIRPPKHDGGGFMGTYQIFNPGPINNITVFKKADDARIRELLAICNWLAAPFGTEEYLFRRYGLEGVDYTFSNGQPSQTQAGVTQINGLGVRYIVDAPDTLFVPGNPQATQILYDFQKQVLPTSVPDASATLYSDTWARKQGQLGTIIMNAQNDVMSGRQPVSAWDDIVKQWRQTGGDQVRAEFEAAAAAAK